MPDRTKVGTLGERFLEALNAKTPSVAELEKMEFGEVDKAHKTTTVSLAALNLDLRYQFDPETEPGRKGKLLNWMADNNGYDPNEHGPLFVNRRPDGSLWNMDGGGGAF